MEIASCKQRAIVSVQGVGLGFNVNRFKVEPIYVYSRDGKVDLALHQSIGHW